MYYDNNAPVVLVFAGPNGSGKSTVTDCAGIVGEYVNADKIKANRNCTDLEAAQEAERIRELLIKNRMDFTFETVLSTPRNLILLQKAKNAGYFIKIIYILTNDVTINIQRVKNRVKAGGHDVPEEKIRSRYEKSLSNIKEIARLADEMLIFDNSGDEPVMICEAYGNRLICHDNPFWDRDSILALFGL